MIPNMVVTPVTRWESVANYWGKKYNVPPALILGDIQQESGGHQTIVNTSSGATGLGQFEPSTWNLVMPGVPFSQAKNGPMNIEAMAKYMHSLDVTYKGNWDKVLNSYSGGGGPKYYNSVLSNASRYQQQFQTSPTLSSPYNKPQSGSVNTSGFSLNPWKWFFGGQTFGSVWQNIWDKGPPSAEAVTPSSNDTAIQQFLINLDNLEHSTGIEPLLMKMGIFVFILIIFILSLYLLFGGNSVIPGLPELGGEI